MRGPGRSTPRRPLTDDEVHALLLTATARLLEAEANDLGTRSGNRRRHRAELDLLLLRRAADTGARRGELAALRVTTCRDGCCASNVPCPPRRSPPRSPATGGC